MSKRSTLHFELHKQRLRWIYDDTLVHPSIFLSDLNDFNRPVLFLRPGVPGNPLSCLVFLFLVICVFEKHLTFISFPDNRGWIGFFGRERFSNLARKCHIILSFYSDDLPFLKGWGFWEEEKKKEFTLLIVEVINEKPSHQRKPSNLPHVLRMFCSTSHESLLYSLPAHTCTVRCYWYSRGWVSRCYPSPPVCGAAVSQQTWSSRCMLCQPA